MSDVETEVRALLESARCSASDDCSKGTKVLFGFEAIYEVVRALVKERDDATTRLIESVGPSDTKLETLEAKLADRDATIERLVRAFDEIVFCNQGCCDHCRKLANEAATSCLAAPAPTPGPEAKPIVREEDLLVEYGPAWSVTITHKPTGLRAEGSGDKSLLRNKAAAIGRLMALVNQQSGDAKGEAPARKVYFVKHRTDQERSGSGHRPPDLPWEYDGPFDTYDEARAHWDKIRPDWQEGGMATKCSECGEYRWA
jgi:hypothetical protein